MTYSVYNIKVDNEAYLPLTSTVLATDAQGKIIATAGGGGGSQTLEQTLALGNSAGTYSIQGVSNFGVEWKIENLSNTDPTRGGLLITGDGLPYISMLTASSPAFSSPSGIINLGGNVEISDELQIFSLIGSPSLLAVNSNGLIVATSSPTGGGSNYIKLENQTIGTSSWFSVGSYYGYTFSNVNIGTNSVVDFTPYNDYIDEVQSANFYPYIMTTASTAVLYAQSAPTASIVGEIVIWN